LAGATTVHYHRKIEWEVREHEIRQKYSLFRGDALGRWVDIVSPCVGWQGRNPDKRSGGSSTFLFGEVREGIGISIGLGTLRRVGFPFTKNDSGHGRKKRSWWDESETLCLGRQDEFHDARWQSYTIQPGSVGQHPPQKEIGRRAERWRGVG